jgi:hypothetical protein
MRAYLSYQHGDDISTIIQILETERIDIYNSKSDLSISKSLQDSIKNAIKESDFVILVYTKGNSNIAFEAGIACGLNKPIFAILSPEGDQPDFLLDSTYVHALPNEFGKIKFSFSVFYSKIPRKKIINTVKKPSKWYGGGDVIITESLLNMYDGVDKSSGIEIENYFQKVLEYFNIISIKKEVNAGSEYSADFAIWDDTMANMFTNPILVEIKSELTPGTLQNLTQRIEKSNSKYLDSSWLVFYDRLRDLNPDFLPSNNKLLFINISNFLKQLRITDFSKSVRKIRNEIIHKF